MPYLICVIDTNHEQLLPHFLKHYRMLEVNRFVFGIRRGRSNPAWSYISGLGANDIEMRETNPDPNSINGDVDSLFMNGIKDELGDWYVPADLDEFHAIEGGISFLEARRLCEEQGADFVNSRMVDRIAPGGAIPSSIKPTPDIHEQFPERKSITGDIMGGCTSKVCLAHSRVSLDSGHHKVVAEGFSPAKFGGKTMHFKWFGDVVEREKIKYETRKRLNSLYKGEQEALFAHLVAFGGKLA